MVELALKVGRKEVEKNYVIKFAVLSEHIHKLGKDLVDLKRKRFGAGKALLEECCGLVREMKERVRNYWEGGAKEMEGRDGIEVESDGENIGEFDAVGQLVKVFVSLDG